ncbi:MAG: hypothetical protein AAF806_26725 [Bacteroidota bacterium]
MRTLLKVTFSLLFACLLTNSVSAQSYKSAVGARLGYPLSASFKTFINDSDAIEVYAGFRGFSTSRWVSVSGAYQKHDELSDVLEGLSWYYGGGASVYFWTYDFSNDFANTSIGIQGYIGLDYKFSETPLSLSIDWIPSLFLGRTGIANNFGGGYGSLGVRYVFKE